MKPGPWIEQDCHNLYKNFAHTNIGESSILAKVPMLGLQISQKVSFYLHTKFHLTFLNMATLFLPRKS